jgi:hypothetical protein
MIRLGNVSGGDHREFPMASGEMTENQYLAFNLVWMEAFLPMLADGAILTTFIDWRGYPIVHAAAAQQGLAPLNLVIWSKTNAGMGSLYRSQYELLPLLKKGAAPLGDSVAAASPHVDHVGWNTTRETIRCLTRMANHSANPFN